MPSKGCRGSAICRPREHKITQHRRRATTVYPGDSVPSKGYTYRGVDDLPSPSKNVCKKRHRIRQGGWGIPLFTAGAEPVARVTLYPNDKPLLFLEQRSQPSHWGFTSNNKNTKARQLNTARRSSGATRASDSQVIAKKCPKRETPYRSGQNSFSEVTALLCQKSSEFHYVFVATAVFFCIRTYRPWNCAFHYYLS